MAVIISTYGIGFGVGKKSGPTFYKEVTFLPIVLPVRFNTGGFIIDHLWKKQRNGIYLPMKYKTSFDVVNLYLSVPIDEAVAVIIEILNDNIDDLRKRTKLTFTDIYIYI